MDSSNSKPILSKHAHQKNSQPPTWTYNQRIQSTQAQNQRRQTITDVNPQTKKNNIKSKNFFKFFTEVKQEVMKNRDTYDQFLQAEDILNILSAITSQYVTQSTATEIISIVLNFLSYCKNQVGCNPVLKTIFTKNFPKTLAEKWLKIKQETFNFNKSQLKILSYLVENPNSGKKIYNGCFQDLKFDLSQEEVKQIAENVFKMAKEDIRSFCFLSTYFLKSCIMLQRKKIPLSEIIKRYQNMLTLLAKIYPAAPRIEADEQLLKYHKSILHSELIPSLSFCLKGQPNRQQTLENFIMERAEESISYLGRFTQMMKEICSRNGGFQFKAGVKIQERKQHKALLRIKEKMLAKYYLEILKQKMKQSKIESSLSIQQSFVQEKAAYEQEMQKIFENQDEPIEFDVRDMLRGKCLFTGVDNINQCCSDILKTLQQKDNEDLKLVQIDNRLQKGTSDLVVRILFGKNVITELQLVIILNVAENEFNHKIYELKRSNFFTPLTQLSILNQDLSNEYFGEVKQVIEANMREKKEEDYESVVSFEEISQNFQAFVENLPIKLNVNEEMSEMNLKFLKKEVKMFEKIQMSKKGSEVKTRNATTVYLEKGKYFYQMKEIQRAEKYFTEAEKCLENKKKKMDEKELEDYLKILLAKGNVMEDKGKYKKALQYYGKCMQIQEKGQGNENIDTGKFFFGIGNAYNQQGQYLLAIEYYQKYLQIQEKTKGKDTIDIASTLNNIGVVYANQSSYILALENYKKCLQIQEKVKGKGSIATALTLNNIGNVYNQQGQYLLALEYIQKCLQIKEKVKGKGSIDTAPTLSNIGSIYKDQGKYPQALEYYKKCLQIQEKVKGKGSIDTALVLNNIGIVYSQQGKYPQALDYLQKCLQIQEKVKGKCSIDTSSTLSNIGSVYYKQGWYSLSYIYYSQSLSIFDRFNYVSSSKKVANYLRSCLLMMNRSREADKLSVKYHL